MAHQITKPQVLKNNAMTLRTKTLWVIGSALVGLLVLLLSISSTILLKGFIELDNQHIEKDVDRLVNVLSEELNHLFVEVGDYAAWDDTYDYMNTHNKAYVASNFVESTFESLNLNVLILLDTKGEIVFSQGYDTTYRQFVPIPQSLLKHLGTQSLFRYRPETEDKITGFVLLPKQVMLIATHPILTSENKGTSRGTLIMGRLLNKEKIQQFAQLTHLPVSMQRIDNKQLPDDFANAFNELLKSPKPLKSPKSSTIVTQILAKNKIAGYIIIKDVYQQPAILLRVLMPREIYQQGLSSLRYLGGFVLVFVLGFAGSILWLFERLVLTRLAVLSVEVTQCRATDTLSTVTVEGNDELAHLATAINTMLTALDASHAKLRQSEASLAEAQHIAHLGNWDWNVINKRFYCSDEIYRIFALQPQSVKPNYTLFLSYVHPNDRRKVSSTIGKAMKEGKSYSVKYRIIVPQKATIRFIHSQGKILKDNKGQVVHVIGTLQDITTLKLAQAETERLLEDNRFLISRSMAIQEEERRELSRELHDELGQCITAIQADAKLITEISQGRFKADEFCDGLCKVSLSANAILSVSDHIYDVVHSLMRQLRPSSLDELGLVETLQDLVTTWQTRFPETRCILTTTEDLYHLDETINISIYRVVQECLTNVKKYAQASQVSITLNIDSEAETLTLCVQDNGRGMNPTQHKRGLGLIGMRERAQALEGHLQLESAPSQGVKIIFTIPIADEYLQKHRKWEK
jgi:sensor domain CHASE-containing protein/two-component sensor histidine kinase